MGKNNNKLLSLFLLTSIVTTTSIFSGILSISKERYERSEAAVTYKTIYLSVPETQIPRHGGGDSIYWDQDEDLRVVSYDKYLEDNDEPGIQMQKISNHLYSATITSDYYYRFYFASYINSEKHWNIAPTNDTHRFNNVTNGANLFTISKYNCILRSDSGSWTGYSVTTADAFASTFLTVVGDGTCVDTGDTTLAKLQAVWGEMNALYTGLNQTNKDALHDASIEGTKPINKFAALYNYIYWKYDSSVGSNFINRSITPLSSVTRYTPTSISEMDTSNLIIAISSGLAVISITGLYFYIRKRKQD